MTEDISCQHRFKIQHVNVPVEPIENYPMEGLEHAICEDCGYCLNCDNVYPTTKQKESP